MRLTPTLRLTKVSSPRSSPRVRPLAMRMPEPLHKASRVLPDALTLAAESKDARADHTRTQTLLTRSSPDRATPPCPHQEVPEAASPSI